MFYYRIRKSIKIMEYYKMKIKDGGKTCNLQSQVDEIKVGNDNIDITLNIA